jgi:hypothetical protein
LEKFKPAPRYDEEGVPWCDFGENADCEGLEYRICGERSKCGSEVCLPEIRVMSDLLHKMTRLFNSNKE